MSKSIFIKDIGKEEIEIDDFPAAYKEAKLFCKIHENIKKLKDEKGVVYLPDAHERWNYILCELEKMAMEHPSLLNPQP